MSKILSLNTITAFIEGNRINFEKPGIEQVKKSSKTIDSTKGNELMNNIKGFTINQFQEGGSDNRSFREQTLNKSRRNKEEIKNGIKYFELMIQKGSQEHSTNSTTNPETPSEIPKMIFQPDLSQIRKYPLYKYHKKSTHHHSKLNDKENNTLQLYDFKGRHNSSSPQNKIKPTDSEKRKKQKYNKKRKSDTLKNNRNLEHLLKKSNHILNQIHQRTRTFNNKLVNNTQK